MRRVRVVGGDCDVEWWWLDEKIETNFGKSSLVDEQIALKPRGKGAELTVFGRERTGLGGKSADGFISRIELPCNEVERLRVGAQESCQLHDGKEK